MSIPYSSTANLPQGFETLTANDGTSNVTYKVDAVSIPSAENRKIERSDENGDRADFMLRDGAEHIEGTITLQRANISTKPPANGVNFSYDFDRTGTNSTLVVNGATVTRDKNEFDVFEIPVVVETYQG